MKNLIESAAREMHRELTTQHPEFCTCARCSDDVLALVMNHVRPRYATSPQGFALAGLDIWSDQGRAQLSVIVYDAMRRVAENPRHTPGQGTKPVS